MGDHEETTDKQVRRDFHIADGAERELGGNLKKDYYPRGSSSKHACLCILKRNCYTRNETYGDTKQ
jgi:hypothetical protein